MKDRAATGSMGRFKPLNVRQTEQKKENCDGMVLPVAPLKKTPRLKDRVRAKPSIEDGIE